MNKLTISEQQIKSVLDKILIEESSKVKREDFNRVIFKIEELENSLIETTKELNKLKSIIPSGLSSVCNGRMNSIEFNLNSARNLIIQLRNKIKRYRYNVYNITKTDEKLNLTTGSK